MATDLARAYRACARATRHAARNFYFAFLSLPRTQRRAAYALYTFCREADDCVDAGAVAPALAEGNGAVVPPPRAAHDDNPDDLAARRTGLEELRDRLARAARGVPKTERDIALADAMSRFGVREEDLGNVLTGVEMDLAPMRIETDDELRTYCYHVASAVGLATLPILTNGDPPTEAMREAAVDLGLGMQYVNILRDVGEDLAVGRIYLPSEDLAAHGIDEVQLNARTMSGGLRAVLAIHGRRARVHLDRGRRLLTALPRRSRACPWLLSEIYGRILARIVEADYGVFGQRVCLPASEKLWLLLSSTWRRV